MANILLTWELGAGLGHLFPLSVLGKELVRRGHTVTVALRDVARAEAFFSSSAVKYVQAPAKLGSGLYRVDPIRSYAGLLNNVGFGDATELAGLHQAWRTLFELVRPQLVVVDHSPTAILALREMPIPVACFGIGFYCPPADYPLVAFPPWNKHDPAILADEARVLQNANRLLSTTGRAPLEFLGELFSGVTSNLLMTFSELDHFGPRKEKYWGTLASGPGAEPVWPSIRAPRAFAYLKGYGEISTTLEVLSKSRLSVLAVCQDLTDADIRQLSTKRLRIQREPVDLQRVAEQCEYVITNASHGVAAHFLLAGKPAIMLPVVVEQFLIAQRIAKLQAGICVRPGDRLALEQAIDDIAGNAKFSEAALRFANRYQGHDSTTAVNLVADHLEGYLP